MPKANDEEDYFARFRSRRRLTYLATTMLTVVIVVASMVFLFPRQAGSPMAAIVDQLSSSTLGFSGHSNSTFINHTRQLLQTRFPRVDYFSDNATVDNYRSLSAYRLIIWRAHSAIDEGSKYVAISTSERYGTANYDQYLENGQLTLCNITGDPNLYFAITPNFVKEVISGRFQETAIVMMSCNGLSQTYLNTAKSFVEKGVKIFISWDGWIDKIDNDVAISSLLDCLVTENNTISEAFSKIRHTYDSPIYGRSTLKWYPTEASDYRIPNYSQDNATKGSTLRTMAILRKTESTRLC